MGGLDSRAKSLVRMPVLHFLTPVGIINETFFGWMKGMPGLFPPAFLESMRLAAWNNVMNGGSLVHFLVAVLALAIGLAPLRRRGRWPSHLTGFSAALLMGYVLLSFIGAADGIFGVRYQLPFLALSAPLVALTFPLTRNWLIGLSAVGLFVLASPYILLNQTRPVVGQTPWPTKIDSVFTLDDAEILFAQSPDFQDEYQAVANAVKGSDCGIVALDISEKDLEYTLWWLMVAPVERLHLLHVNDGWKSPADNLGPAEACALICTACSAVPWRRGLPLALDAGHVRLYLAEMASER